MNRINRQSPSDLESSTDSSNEEAVTKHKTGHRKAKFIGFGAAGGAVIGAIAGGGKGLAFGAGVGAVMERSQIALKKVMRSR